MALLLKLVQVPLDGTLSFKRVHCTIQLGVICKLTEGALDSAVHVIDEDIKQSCCHHRPLVNNSCTDVGQKIDHYLLNVTIQPIPQPLNSSPIKSVSLKFRENDYVGTMSKALIQFM